jgi:hypothetical protein
MTTILATATALTLAVLLVGQVRKRRAAETERDANYWLMVDAENERNDAIAERDEAKSAARVAAALSFKSATAAEKAQRQATLLRGELDHWQVKVMALNGQLDALRLQSLPTLDPPSADQTIDATPWGRRPFPVEPDGVLALVTPIRKKAAK